MMDLKNKRILVTGGAGFIGSAVVAKLKKRGCTKIFVPRSKDYDLTKLGNVVRLYADSAPEVVLHLAARVGGVAAHVARPAEFFYDNLIMGVNMVHQGHIFGIEKFVSPGTGSAYPETAPIPFKEEELWNGYPEAAMAPYSLAKKALIIQTQAYRQQYGFKAVNLVLANIYGPGAKAEQVVTALVKRFVDAVQNGAGEVLVWGAGNATRDFLYVDDCAEAIVLATEKCETVEPINIGTGVEVSIKYLAHLIAELVGFNGQIAWDSSKPEGQLRRCLDVTKAKREFGFVARTSIGDGVKRTIEWYNLQKLRLI